jgi:hypothetical protein
MRNKEEYTTLLESKGIPLAMLGVRDIALRRNDALQAVECLRAAEIPILGGDVYFQRNGRIEAAYANWHADPKREEDWNAYLRRSWSSTEDYIRGFPDNKDIEPLFSLVTG